MLNQDFNYVVAGVGEPKDKKKKKKRDALAAGTGEQAIAGFSEHEGTRDISEAGLIDFEPEEATSLTGYTAVSEGQRQHIDYLLNIVDDDLAWVALAVIKEYGLPSKEQYAEYMSQFAGSGLDDESDRRALELLDEVRHSDWDKRLAQADSAPVETTAQDLADNTREQPSIGIEVLGILRAYKQETFVPGVDSPHMTYEISGTPAQFRYLRTSDSGNAAYLIEIDNEEYWIDTFDPDAEFVLVPFVENENYPTQTSAEIIATDAPSGYEILPIIPDEKAHGGPLDIEISDRPWADRTTSKLGVRTRDYNRRRDIYNSFRLQSPVIGPDVRVEFVVTGHKDLGNYVVISFPSFVYQSNDEIMRQLEWQGLAAQRLRAERPDQERLVNSVDHNPDRWHEDGRIFYAFAHLSEIYVNAGEIIDSESKAIIGKTGNTGKEGITHHLDLAILYIGSSQPGSGAMEEILNDKRKRFEDTGSRSVEYFFDLAQMSQLYPNGVSVLYAENLESARIHPELDEFRIAEFPTSGGDPNASIYFEDE